jgi:DNA invertase Pin-like site-specific DNA recombinase
MVAELKNRESDGCGMHITNVEFFTDNGISGTKSSRPALDQMMAAVERGEVSAVVVPSFSRFARSTTHLLTALTRFKQKGVHFVNISERIDTNSAIGVAIFSILAAIAQFERDLIASRVKIGLENARAKGRQIGRKKMRDSDLIRKLFEERNEFSAGKFDREMFARLGRRREKSDVAR